MRIQKFSLVPALVCVLSLISHSVFASDEWVSITEKVKPSVVTVINYDDKGEPISSGSGFFIAENRIVTNRHVVEGSSQAKVKTIAGKTFSVKGIMAESEERDLVILSIDIPKKMIKPLELAQDIPKEGQDILVIGSPLGLDQTVSTGIVSSIRELPGFGEVIQITAPISPGSSGGPILDCSGKVMGVVVSQLIVGQNLNFSLPASCIKGLKESEWGKPQPLGNDKVYALEIASADIEIASALLIYSDDKVSSNKSLLKAIKHCQEAIRLKPHKGDAHWSLGTAYRMLGRYEEAISAYEEAIQYRTDNIVLYDELGDLYFYLKRYKEALTAYKEVIRLNPKSDLTHWKIGNSYSNLKLYEEAISAYKAMSRFSPDSSLGNWELGNIYSNLKRYQEAISAYKEVIRIRPQMIDAETHLKLGVAYKAIGDLGSALDEYRILKELDKELAEELFNVIYPE